MDNNDEVPTDIRGSIKRQSVLNVVKSWQFAHDSQELVLFSLALLSAIHKDNRVADLQHPDMRNDTFRPPRSRTTQKQKERELKDGSGCS